MIDVFIRDSLNNALVTVPRGAYLRSSPYERTGLNARFLELASRIGYRNRTEYKEIFDQIQRWILSQKQSDGSFGSTAQTAEVLRSLFEGLARPSSMKVAVTLDTTPIMQTDIVGSGVYESFSGFIPLPSFHTASMLHLAKQGSGTLFYDLALTTLFPARTVTSRDE